MKTKPTDLVLDFLNPTRGMLQRDGEDPDFAVIAVIPDHSDLVVLALNQLSTVLQTYLDQNKMILTFQDKIELLSGKIITLGKDSIFFSLSYPTAPSRIFEMELAAPATATIH